MTGLVFVLEEASVCIGMDTLVHTMEPDGSTRPLCFASKMHLLPHAQTVLLGTGVAELVLHWYSLVESSIVAIDLEALDRLAAERLPQLWEKHKRVWAERGVAAPATATIYQFGFLRREQRYAGFAYRSENGFVSERLEYGIGIKPIHARAVELCARFMDEEPQDEGFIERLFVTLLEALKEEDERPEEKAPVGIGGEVHLLKLRDSRFELSVVKQFGDYAEDFEAMLARHSAKDEDRKGPATVSADGESD